MLGDFKIMKIIVFISSLVRNAIYSAERDRIGEKFGHFDSRLDVLERDNAVVKEQIQSLHEVSTANLEAIEQKVNATNSTVQALDLIVKHHLAYLDTNLTELKNTMKSCLRQ
jgi:hypothetical protein